MNAVPGEADDTETATGANEIAHACQATPGVGQMMQRRVGHNDIEAPCGQRGKGIMAEPHDDSGVGTHDKRCGRAVG